MRLEDYLLDDLKEALPDYCEPGLDSLRSLAAKIDSGVDVAVFVGAGVSVPFGAPAWGPFLKGLVTEYEVEYPDEAKLAKNALEAGNLEEVAEILRSANEGQFESQIETKFSQPATPEATAKSVVPDLVEICGNVVVTTNFDRFLEDSLARRPGTTHRRVSPSKDVFKTAADQIANQKPIFLKLHGDWSERESRVITKADYKKFYCKEDAADDDNEAALDLNKPLPLLLQTIAATRIFLFVGCSLESDRTFDVLNQLHEKVGGHHHYALMSAPRDALTTAEVTSRLRGAGILPIWFPVDEDNIHDPYLNLKHILRFLAGHVAPVQIRKYGARLNGPYEVPSIWWYNELRKSNTTSRHCCSADGYMDFAVELITRSGPLKKVVWTMNGSPLKVPADLLNEEQLSPHDIFFKGAPSTQKRRIIIFEDAQELKEYKDATGAALTRKTKFEESVTFNKSGELLFATKASLADGTVLNSYFDIGYVEGHEDDGGILFCSPISSSELGGCEEPSNTECLHDVMLFPYMGSPSHSHNWEEKTLSDLFKVYRTIRSILSNTYASTSGGVYDDIEKLVTYTESNGQSE